ncbi:unnamed protein product [Discosporangium mesarthrocarpum]
MFSRSFFAGALSYMLTTFFGGFVWHLVLFKSSYHSLDTWTRFEEPVIPLGFAAITLQVCRPRAIICRSPLLTSGNNAASTCADFRVSIPLCQGMLLSHMLPMYLKASGSRSTTGGARFGLWVGGMVFSLTVLAHVAKNKVACAEGFAVLEGIFCLLQFPASCVAMAAAQKRTGARHVSEERKKA